jgi:uncharacterized protein
MTFDVTGDQVIAGGFGNSFCDNSQGSFAFRGVASGILAKDGTFTATPANNSAEAILIKGTVPQKNGEPWSGSYTVSLSGPGTPACAANLSGIFTATSFPLVSGIYVGTGSLLTGPTGVPKAVPVTLQVTLQQGGIVTNPGNGAASNYFSNALLTGSIKVQGSPCFSSGATQSAPASSVIGNMVNARFLMDDGSTLLLEGPLTDVTEAHISTGIIVVQGGNCGSTTNTIFLPGLDRQGWFDQWMTGLFVDTVIVLLHSAAVVRTEGFLLETERSSLFAPAAVVGVCLLLGLVAGGWILGSEIKEIRLADRYVTVKGLVERTVKSDMATWPVSFKEAGNDLPQVFAKSEADKTAVLKFFAGQGIAPGEITVGQIKVTDKLANEYGGNNTGPRYIVEQTVTVQSKDVDKISKAGQKTADLVQEGIVVGGTNGQQGGIRYEFTGLNALKPDMITEATRNARASADRFAADSGSQVGSIRSASQGVFSISPAGSGAAPDEGGGGGDADASIMKKVRVVSTVDYYLVR